MNTSTVETQRPSATSAKINDEILLVELSDGRAISVPLACLRVSSIETDYNRGRSSLDRVEK